MVGSFRRCRSRPALREGERRAAEAAGALGGAEAAWPGAAVSLRRGGTARHTHAHTTGVQYVGGMASRLRSIVARVKMNDGEMADERRDTESG